MPTVSLRLTEEELSALREWAYGARRSLQKEIVWRLFSGGVGGAGVEVVTATVDVPAGGPQTEEAESVRAQPVAVSAASPPSVASRNRRSRTEMCEHRRRPDEFCARCNGEEAA